MSKSQYKAKHVCERKSQYKQCVPPCKRYISAGVVSLGAREPTAFASMRGEPSPAFPAGLFIELFFNNLTNKFIK